LPRAEDRAVAPHQAAARSPRALARPARPPSLDTGRPRSRGRAARFAPAACELVSPAVSDLRDRFVSLLERLGATPDPSPLPDDLRAAGSEPGRPYHDVRHREDCLTQAQALPLKPRMRDLVEVALWFHDAVYDPRSADNEERSARWASEALVEAGVPAPVAAD